MSNSEEGARPATISDVATAAGVSRTTVSRYLSQKFGSMSPATRERISDVIETLKYRPNRLARGLRSDKSYTIGFVIPDITNPYAISVLRGAEAVAEEHGYMLMVCNSDRDPAKERRYFEVLKSYGMDGLLVFATGHNDDAVGDLARGDFPLVLIDQDVSNVQVDLVSSDNVTAVNEALDYLLSSGYDDVAYFTDIIGTTASRAERADVFRATLAHRTGVASRVYEADVREDDQLDEALERFLEEPRGASRVIFAGNGVMMLKIYGRLKARGIRIPDDVSLIGFDDDEWASSAEPPLTTIAQATSQIGATAAQLLLARINGKSPPASPTRLATRLIVRNSTVDRSRRAEQNEGTS